MCEARDRTWKGTIDVTVAIVAIQCRESRLNKGKDVTSAGKHTVKNEHTIIVNYVLTRRPNSLNLDSTIVRIAVLLII